MSTRLQLDVQKVLDVLDHAGFSPNGWRELGQRLGVRGLDAINADHIGEGVKRCLEEVIRKWWKRRGDCRWDTLIRAVGECGGVSSGGGAYVAKMVQDQVSSLPLDPEELDEESTSDDSSPEDDDALNRSPVMVQENGDTFSTLNVDKIYQVIKGAEKKVCVLGFQLNLTPNTRRKLNTPGMSAEEQLLKTLEEYKKQPEPSWEGIADALDSEMVRLNDLAKTVRESYCPGWEVKVNFHNLKTLFGELISAISDAIEKQGKGVKEVVDAIRGLPKVREERDKDYFMKYADDLRHSESVPSLFDRLTCHWDYLHPEIYSPLTKELSLGRNLESKSNKYLQKKKEFINKTPLAEFCRIPDIEEEKGRDPPKGFRRYVTKLNREPPPMLLSDIERLRRKLARKCNLQSCAVTVVGLKLHCVIITMWVPSETDYKLISRDLDFINEHSIMQMVFNDIVVYSQEKKEIGSSVDTVRKPEYPSTAYMALRLVRKTVFDRPVSNIRKRWKSPLTKAVESGNVEEVRRLIASGEELNPDTVSTPLKEACSKGNLEIAQVLLDAGADPNHLTDEWTPLMEAARLGNKEMIKLLVENGAEPNTINTEKWTAIMAASNNGRTDAVDQLLQLGADPNMQDHVGWSALLASVFKEHEAIALRLAESKANPHLQNVEYRSALRLAMEFEQYTVVDAFLDIYPDVKAGLRGHPDLDTTDKYGGTDLLYACKVNNIRFVTKLLRKGADPNIVNHDGDFSLYAAVEHENVEMVKELLRTGANPRMITKYGESALTEAARNGSDEIVAELIHAGADPNHFSNEGTSLAIAARRGNLQIVKHLISAGADPNLAEFLDQLPLEHAKQINNKEMIQFLSKHNADDSKLKELPRRRSSQLIRSFSKYVYENL